MRRIWLDTVLAGERERLINIQIHLGMMQCGESFNQPPVFLNLPLQVPTYTGTEIDECLGGRSGKVGSEKVRLWKRIKFACFRKYLGGKYEVQV